MNLHIYIKYTDSLHVQLWYHSCYSTHVNSVQYVICFDIRNSTSSRKEKKTQQYSQSFKVHVIQYTADDTTEFSSTAPASVYRILYTEWNVPLLHSKLG